MSILQKMKEKKAAKVHEAIQEERQKVEEEAKKTVRDYTSRREIARRSIPQIIFGAVLAIVEYKIIGAYYTLASLVVFIPVMYVYTRSLMAPHGKYLLVVDVSGDNTNIVRYFIPDELWGFIKFDHPLVPGMITFNHEDTYLSTGVEMLEGSNIIWKVHLAWLHFNQLEYARNRGILEKSLSFATNISLENAELEKMKEMLAIQEGKRQTSDRLKTIQMAYRDDANVLRQKIAEMQAKINEEVKMNNDLLFGEKEKNEENGKEEKEVEE